MTVEAARMETETLELVVKILNDIVWHRKSGKLPGLELGSVVHAQRLDYNSQVYGEVVRITPKACVVQSPGLDLRIA